MYNFDFVSISDLSLVYQILCGKSISELCRETGFSHGKIKSSIERVEEVYGIAVFIHRNEKRHLPTQEGLAFFQTIETILKAHGEWKMSSHETNNEG